MTDDDGVDPSADRFDLDVLVNNAGANFPGGRDEWVPDVFEESVALNLSGPLRLTVAASRVALLIDRSGGASVVNVVSMSAYLAVPIVPGYGSGKAGLLQLTRNLAALWAPDAIRVNAVAPGVIDTPMTAPMKDIPALFDETSTHVPMGRLGTVDEVAPVALFLCTRASELHHRSRPRGRRRLPHPLMSDQQPAPRDRLPRRGPPGRPHRGEPRRGDDRMARGSVSDRGR